MLSLSLHQGMPDDSGLPQLRVSAFPTVVCLGGWGEATCSPEWWGDVLKIRHENGAFMAPGIFDWEVA